MGNSPLGGENGVVFPLRRSRAAIFLVALVFMVCPLLHAAPDAGKNEAAAVSEPFERGRKELQFGGGFGLSENFQSVARPQINDVDVHVRLGMMLNDPSGAGILRGNFEFLLEGFGGAIVKGPGDALLGATMILRRNMIFGRSKWAPYYQIGGGGVYSDAHTDQSQRSLGSPFMFNLQAGFGTRYFVTEKAALYLEFDYRHISNSGLAERNGGLNSAVGWLGVSCFF